MEIEFKYHKSLYYIKYKVYQNFNNFENKNERKGEQIVRIKYRVLQKGLKYNLAFDNILYLSG